ncbi:putative N-ethylammeline chlorohydrolase [Monocercomonoides exilis]|uniref:putative N-ethylammeline chlorohydrolase n=1 Tax=Monocercomonoides exilis TaxID=2049356 RepID=UPI003559680C|nr:putative N-ethylammeline chlorohydrolase [Monocercomonoides exilis]|eukprot:MONOS_6308.1-p1 / transcript=MONOS_6308.1 / gene=MONOS_6308 / organism=Monocercomonoides_exilis_PA203 / gene_product=N-ethylammeline chlorohydrolase / transcript_product=N-ethylammeline chlorohydrolase / location=Mono_scaffold00197:11202-12819(+) / protein_length=516 / sequence_SO=supercontig / SO=protein_coding / is_pseudo=false
MEFKSPKQKTRFLIIRADFLVSMSEEDGSEERIEDGYVLGECSTIKECGHFTPEIGERILKECGDDLTIIGKDDTKSSRLTIPKLKAVILPGFVKAHGHDHESSIIGICKDMPLVDWLDGAINPFTRFLSERQEELKERLIRTPNLIAYRKARADDVYYGITTALTHHCNFNKYYVHELVDANIEAGTKMIVAVGSQDRNYDPRVLDQPVELATQRLDKYYEQFKDAPRTWIIPGPDQVFSNGPEILKQQKEWANKHGTLIHIHSAEEYGTTQWFREKYKMTEVEYLESIGFLSPETMLAHQVHSTEHDLELIAKYKVKVVHNPLANTILGSGMPDIVKMRAMGIDVAISTDGSGSADNQNILAAARLASQYQRGLHHDAKRVPAIDALKMITSIPGKILRLKVGQVRPGYDMDLAVVDLTRPNLIPSSKRNVVENLIWASDGSEVGWVVANGVVLKENHKLTQVNIGEICSDISQLQEMFLEFLATAKIMKATGERVDANDDEDEKPSESSTKTD